MRPAPTPGVEETITVDHAVAGVLEEWKAEDERRRRRGRSAGDPGPGRVGFRQVAQELPRLRVGIDADREDPRLGSGGFVEKSFQLAELMNAVRSPAAAVEHEHDVGVSSKIRECDRNARLAFEREVRGGITHPHSVEVGRRKISAVPRAEPTSRRHAAQRERSREYGDCKPAAGSHLPLNPGRSPGVPGRRMLFTRPLDHHVPRTALPGRAATIATRAGTPNSTKRRPVKLAAFAGSA